MKNDGKKVKASFTVEIHCQFILLIPHGDSKSMKHTYALKQTISHGMGHVRFYSLLQWCIDYHARLVIITVAGKSKLTVSTQNWILDPRCFRKSRLEF